MKVRRVVWLIFLALFAGLVVLYAVWLVGSWKRSDGSGWEEAAVTFAIAGVPGIAAALNVALIHYSKRALQVIAAIAASTALAALVFAKFVPISGFVAVLAAIALVAMAVTALVGIYRSRGDAMMWAASIALLVSAGLGMLTWGGALPICVALLIVAAATLNVARADRLVPSWPIVAIVVIFVLATSGIALVVLIPAAVVAAAIVVFRRRGLKQRVHVAEDRGD
jgi:hypothetical protein